MFCYCFNFLSLCLQPLCSLPCEQVVPSGGFQWSSAFIPQVLNSFVSDLGSFPALSVCLSACGSGLHLPLGVPSPHRPSPSPLLTGKDPFSAERPRRPREKPVAYVRYAEATSGNATPPAALERSLETKAHFSVPPVLAPTKDKTLKTHIGVCQLARTLFTLHCFRLSIEHIPARVLGQRGR